MKKHLLFFIYIFALTFNCFSQQIWKANPAKLKSYTSKNDEKSRSLILDKNRFLSTVKNASDRTRSDKNSSTILLPVEGNNFEAFELLEASNLSEELAAKFPEIKSYVGKSSQSNKVVRLSYSKYNGLRAFITSDHGTLLIEPTDLNVNAYLAYSKKEDESLTPFECHIKGKAQEVFNKNQKTLPAALGDGYLRKYRMAVATTGEYSNYFLTGNETSDAQRKAVVLAALNTAMTRINGLFERDMGITMELIPDNDKIIYLDASTDPYTSVGFHTADFNQTHLDVEIGANNYDIGHVLSHRFNNYGLAYFGVCLNGFGGKGSAFSSGPNLGTDDFYMVFAHEIGHQMGADHVQSSAQCRSNFELETAVEPGSGSTIMGYAGICFPNVQNEADSYFNYVSIRDALEVTEFRGCGQLIFTGNNTPTVNAGNSFTIPKSTPFILEGSGDDIDNNSIITYSWEQNDPENPNSTSTPQSNWAQGPLFRSQLPTGVPVRYMPKIEEVIVGNLVPTWEMLPSVSRTMNFVLTVRDNASFGPKTASDDMTVTVDGSAGPFEVTSQNSNVLWHVGEIQEITWDVANTNQSPINVNTVAIYLSIDGGYTYPIEVATNVPNTGSYDAIVPDISVSTASARLMVRAENNIFYSINSSDFSVDFSNFSMLFDDDEIDICISDPAVFNYNYQTYSGFNETVWFSVDNLPAGVNATFNPAFAVNNNTEVTLTFSGLDHINSNNYVASVVGKSTSSERNRQIKLIRSGHLSEPTLLSPNNNATQIQANTSLVWDPDLDAKSYLVELATDPAFSNIIEQQTTSQTTITPALTQFYTSYYWRVKSKNECNESDYSNVFTFKTECNDPANITIADITQSSATISWTDNSSVSWEVRIIENTPTTTESIITTSSNSIHISTLSASNDYEVFVRSLCGSDASNSVGPVSFSTPDSCPAPTDFITTNITPNAVGLSWTRNGSETKWELEYGVEGFSQGLGTKVQTSRNPFILTSLSEATNYEVYLKAVCGVNPGDNDSFSDEPLNFSTPISCQAPTDFVANNITSNSVDLAWTNNGSESQWELEYGEAGFTQGQGTTVLTSVNPFTLQGLTASTKYEVYLNAICGTNQGDDDHEWVGPLTFNSTYNVEASLNGFIYYPNPTNNHLIVESIEKITKIEIVNSMGQLISSKQDTFGKKTKIELSNLLIGIYSIRCFTDEKQFQFNIIKS